MLGDRIGRAKTMMITILMYSLCTGLSAFSVTVYDFALYRFLTGLGVGGEFAVGVALVAEVMPGADLCPVAVASAFGIRQHQRGIHQHGIGHRRGRRHAR
jgi:MFS family permease